MTDVGSTGLLGIDIGGTKVAVRVEGPGTQPLSAGFRWTPDADARADMAALAGCLQTVRRDLPGPPRAAGVAVPATLDASGRVTAWPNRPAWAGLDLVAELRRMLPGTAVAVADDGDLAALAEARAAHLDDVLYVGVGTGIGGGSVLGGDLCPGPTRGSFELGHIIVDRTGPHCDCGRQGCAQSRASGRAILRRATELRRAARTGRGTDVPGTTGPWSGAEPLRGADPHVDALLGHPATERRETVPGAGADLDGEPRDASVSYEELCDGWRGRLEWAVGAVDEGCAALGAAIVSASELLHPAAVIVGGGFPVGLPGFTHLVARHAQRLSRPGHPAPAHHEARLGPLSSLHGALHLARATTARPVPSGQPVPR